MYIRGLSFSSEGGSQIYKKKLVSIKLQPPPILATKILWLPPPITDTPYLLNRLILYWNQPFWTKYTHYLWSSCDSLNFGHPKFYDPHIFLPKIYDPPVYLGLPPPPHSEENDSPLNAYWLHVINWSLKYGGVVSWFTFFSCVWHFLITSTKPSTLTLVSICWFNISSLKNRSPRSLGCI